MSAAGLGLPRPCQRKILCTLLLLCIITATATSAYGIIQTCNPDGYIGTCVDVSPGKYSQKLGVDFPTFASVKLSYPSGAILVNSVGDLLFNVTLNPLMLNPLSAQVTNGAFPSPQVQVWGSGFSPSDTTCSLSGSPGSPVVASTCTISGGILTGHFDVDNVPAGVYTIIGMGNPGGDFSSSTFTVLPPSLVLNPSSGLGGVTVSVSGFGFYTTDTTCTITSNGALIVAPTPCTLTGGTIGLGFSFTVAAVPTGTYAVTVTGNPNGDLATATFTVISTSQSITLSPNPYGQVGALVGVLTPVGSSWADTDCKLAGNIITPGWSCSILGGILTGSFTVGNVPPGVYTITAIGSPGGDLATANFQVLPSAPSVPISVPISIDIYIPPDFTEISTNKFWTSFSNDYNPNSISVGSGSSNTIGPGWWRVSVKNITMKSSPADAITAQRAFEVDKSQYIRLFQVRSPVTAGRYFFKVFINGASIGATRFPTIVVEGSRNPAYISGTLRDIGDINQNKAGQPIDLTAGFGARIIATGTDYLGRNASAQAFINSTAQGRYTIFGVAPGTYNITAYAAGFRPTIRPFRVSVLATQSLEGVDIYLPHSVNITGTVRSTTGDNEPIDWGTLYGFNGKVPRSIVIRVTSLDGTVSTSTQSKSLDPIANTYIFSIQREVDRDGRIPQDSANYTSGLTAGDYLLGAYVTSYLQLDEVRVHVTNETKITHSDVRLIRSEFINVTVHFMDLVSNLAPAETQISGTLTVQVFDQIGVLRGSNTTVVPAGSLYASVEIQGNSETRSFGISSLFPSSGGLLPGVYHIYATFTSSPSFTGFANVGIRNLYYQLSDYAVNVGLSSITTVNIPAFVSLPLFKGGGIDLTLYSVDVEVPRVPRLWSFPGAVVNLKIIDSFGNVYRANATQLPDKSSARFFYSGLLTDNYQIVVQTVGYSQALPTKVHVVLGEDSDVAVWMRQEPQISLTLVFKAEGIFSAIDSRLPYAQPINHLNSTPIRIEVFDLLGNFVAADIGYIPNLTNPSPTSASFLLTGFNQYYGDPKEIWSGFYDATDASSQDLGGIPPGKYMILVWVDGYYQSEPQTYVTLGERGNASLIVTMERASRVSGIIAGPDYYDEGRPLSWVTVDVEPGDYTTFSLDGFYQVWVPGGTYGIGFSAPGYSRQTMSIVVPSGSDLRFDVWLNYG